MRRPKLLLPRPRAPAARKRWAARRAPPARGRGPSSPSARRARCRSRRPTPGLLNFCCSVSPVSSPPSSADASASASIWSTFWLMRSKVSKALVSDRPRMVSWMAFCASARFCRAMRMFFLRLASSILSFSVRSWSFSFSTASFCSCHCLPNSRLLLVVLLLARQRLLGQGVVARADRQHRLALPLLATARSARPTASSAASRRRSRRRPASSPRPAGSASRGRSDSASSAGLPPSRSRSFRFDLMSVPSLEKIPMMFPGWSRWLLGVDR